MQPCSAILFLDYDGVLHPVGGLAPRKRLDKLPLLESLLREPEMAGVCIVISSTWRVVYNAAQLRSQFAPDLRERVVGCTPQLSEHPGVHVRHAEISAWLAANPKVRAWAAVDDDVRGFPSHASAQLIDTDPRTGLTEADIARLRALLRAQLQRADLLRATAAGAPADAPLNTSGAA